ncbi:MAG: nitroreductase family protein [Deltaproteobacteria bacterium]|nr:nitroreductase family protein [Deltaproteobacteria bacterium]
MSHLRSAFEEGPCGPLLRIDPETCLRCGACSDVCPQRVLVGGEGAVPSADPAAEAFCIACGHCAAACPAGALSHRAASSLASAAHPPPAESVLAWLRGRRSVRAYRPDPVPREVLRLLLEAARAAPNGHNARTVGCVVIETEGERRELQRRIVAFYRKLFRAVGTPGVPALLSLVLGSGPVRELREAAPSMARVDERLARGEDPLFHHAPVLLLFHAPPAETAEADCALAAGQAALLAPSLGLGTCHIGYASAVLRRFPGLGRSAGVPRGRRAYSVLTAGYPSRGFPRVPPRPELPVRFR